MHAVSRCPRWGFHRLVLRSTMVIKLCLHFLGAEALFLWLGSSGTAVPGSSVQRELPVAVLPRACEHVDATQPRGPVVSPFPERTCSVPMEKCN
jgi:hypothetical protein